MNGFASTARLVVVGGMTSYRALFNWTTPSMYIGTLFASPLFQLLFFVYVGRGLGVAGDEFLIVGNAVLSCSVAGIFGGTMAIANERRYGTLGTVLLSPRSRAAIFLGRGLPYVLNGALVSVTMLGAAALLLGWRTPVDRLPALVLTTLVGAIACTAFGLTLGSVGLRLRDIWLVTNITSALMLLLTGVIVPSGELPALLRGIGSVLPLTHSVAAARHITDGDGFGAAGPDLLIEVGIAVAYTLIAVVLLRVFETEARRRAVLDAM
ncbi:ABC transporter permease [Micromonospora maritima]|uniref:ABC transporter permease n=1 Tax=Micromonospora maritima TaxID=986711 RepID=UPI00157CB6DB|nr:ABC transporter permease [Micromonospora maritima]